MTDPTKAKHVGETITPDIQTTPLLSGDRPLDYHPKVRAHLKRMLSSSQQRLETVGSQELPFHQAAVKIIRMVLGIPKDIEEIERRRRVDGQPTSRPEDFKETVDL